MSQKKILIPFEKYERLLKLGKAKEEEVNTTVIGGGDCIEDIPIIQYGEGQLKEEDILTSIPKSQRSRVRALLIHIRNSNILSWNKRGEIIYKTHLVPLSHIIDLLKDSQREYRNFNPVGVKEFYSALEESNVPRGLISNINRRETVQSQLENNSSSLPPPTPTRLSFSHKPRTVWKEWMTL